MTVSKLAAIAAVLSVPGALASPYFAGQYRANAQQLLTAYDYVVVGGGAAGLTVANRLSEDSDVTVLVIEAGVLDANEDIVTIPGLAGGAIGTKYDWNLTYTVSESLGGRNVSLPQGKVVGGSTKLNRMVFDRGSKSDYDRWATLGNKGWSWDTLLPYFKKNEKFTPPSDAIVAEYNVTFDATAHGTSGNMHSTYSPFFWPTTKNIVAAIKELNIGISNDQANGNAIGGYFCPHNQDPVSVTRSSAREAYYNKVTTRKNLHLITGRQVTRIITKKTSSAVKVTGVEFAASEKAARETVSVKKEAILAAGAIHTPQILQLSGIGDSATLSSIKVSKVVDLPGVGQNFHDHVLLAVVNVISAPLTGNNLTSNATFAAEARAQYDNQKTGPLSSPTGDFLAFLPLSIYSKESTSIHAKAVDQDGATFLPAGTPAEVIKGYKSQQKVLNDKLSSKDSAALEFIWADGVFVLGLQHPYSRGSVKASSASVFDAPIADAGFLRNPLDVTLLAEGVRFARTIAATSAIAPLQPFEVVPGVNVTSDADLEQFIRSSASTLFHPAGSCKMGKREEGGVVDGQLKVYGVQGLRVVDASVIPLLPASHTMTTVYAIAERAADIIKGVCK
ncbi:hypothetical protein G7Z17_g105 [Cylindrodendrum hubeiense]|uniref:Glucose-methanol-choline oxidoreductase N-terminal domain-containing protein n=1 Tax=Cylindrodendrum hubeiense TaxID=595255 RepID=A0A9P5LNH1_9HYPO|nr:hypothetical protein G7Z17_g105 [Cylindrodendrum hubeiense]